jgi:redox-regulated HSP33 family molecular chaperone
MAFTFLTKPALKIALWASTIVAAVIMTLQLVPSKQVEVVVPGKPIIKYIVKNPTNEDLIKAYNTPIAIELTMKGDAAHVVASDTYKQTTQDFQLPQKKSWTLEALLGGFAAGLLAAILL